MLQLAEEGYDSILIVAAEYNSFVSEPIEIPSHHLQDLRQVFVISALLWDQMGMQALASAVPHHENWGFPWQPLRRTNGSGVISGSFLL